MKEYNVEISPEAEEFYLSFNNGWKKAVGHLISVNNIQFSAVPVSNNIIVSDVESGSKLFELPVPKSVESYEQVMQFLERHVSIKLVLIIEKIGIKIVGREIDRMKEFAIKKLGPKPITQKFDMAIFDEDTIDMPN